MPPPTGTPTYVDYLFYRVAPGFRRAPASDRRAATDEFARLLDSPGIEGDVRAYSCLGFRAGTDLLIWIITPKLAEAQKFAAAVRRTALGAHLEETHAYLAAWKPPTYGPPKAPNFQQGPPQHEFVIVYPFTKTHAWYQLPLDERRQIMQQHGNVGAEFPQIKRNDTYSFGIGDQDFMLAFECDEPREFSDLMQRLRETAVRPYTESDTPFFVCRRLPYREMLDGLLGL